MLIIFEKVAKFLDLRTLRPPLVSGWSQNKTPDSQVEKVKNELKIAYEPFVKTPTFLSRVKNLKNSQKSVHVKKHVF